MRIYRVRKRWQKRQWRQRRGHNKGTATDEAGEADEAGEVSRVRVMQRQQQLKMVWTRRDKHRV